MYSVKRGLIVSVQKTFSHESFASNAIAMGAVAIRTNVDHIPKIRNSLGYELPIIGLTKVGIQITPIEHLSWCREEAQYVATNIVCDEIMTFNRPLSFEYGRTIADIDCVKAAVSAEENDCCAITTAMSGYTEKTACGKFDPPDFDLVEECVKKLSIPVIAEGRYWTLDQVEEAFKRGAHSVCIGAAVTRPDLITERFVERISKCI